MLVLAQQESDAEIVEKTYADLVQSGRMTPDQFRARCASYGITEQKHGTQWDDVCMEHEYKNKLGPFAQAPAPAPASTSSSPTPSWVKPALIGTGVAVAAGIVIAIARR